MSSLKRPYYIAATGNLGPIGGTGTGANLHRINVNTAAASAVVTVYDGQSASAPAVKKATIDASAKGFYDFAGAWFKNGIFCVLSGGNADVTVIAE